MQIFGLTIGEIATLASLATGFISGIFFLFKSIVIGPLQSSINTLQKSIENFSGQLEDSKKDRGLLHQRINKMDKRVAILEEHDKWEEKNKK